jgi:hypothetical protein
VSADSSTQLATAVEVAHERTPTLLWVGIGIGVIVASVCAHLMLQWDQRSLSGMYMQMGKDPPTLTKLTLSIGWMVGVPAAAALAIGMLLWRRPRSFVVPVVLGSAFVGALLATWYLPTQPLRELASRIE